MEKILIVEDNETNLYLVRFILETSMHDTIVARNGDQGAAGPDYYGHPTHGHQRAGAHEKNKGL